VWSPLENATSTGVGGELSNTTDGEFVIIDDTTATFSGAS
jgi:hypothetical protein